jgi:retron-type reverse transcriptase
MLQDIRHIQYPESVPFSAIITRHQIEKAVKKTSPRKAPGPDEISNRVIKETLSTTIDHLLTLMQASLNISHFPTSFKHTTTVILRKPGKSDYTKPKAYRPIALESTLGKIMESVIADVLSYLTETYELLPAYHYGGRPGHSAEDAMMEMSERIYDAWKRHNVYTTLFVDVAGAFNNVHHKRLIHNLQKRRVPVEIARWIQSFLQDRTTKLTFNGSTTSSIHTPAGVPQGSPLSPLLYIYYNADLLDISESYSDLSALGFIDDIIFGVEGVSDEANV